MKELEKALRRAKQVGVSSALRTKGYFQDFVLDQDGYRVYDYLHDKNISHSERLFFLTIATKTPLIDSESEEGYQQQMLGFDFRISDKKADGLGVASMLDGLAISLTSDTCWDLTEVVVNKQYLDEAGEFVEEDVIVKHASRDDHVSQLGAWIEQRLKQKVDNGEEMVFRWEELYPALVLCKSVEAQLYKFRKPNALFKQIQLKLHKLNDYFKDWTSGKFDPDAVFPRRLLDPESPRTLEEYPDEHTFLCPDGVKRLFSWHVRVTPHERRIFFYPDTVSRKAFIGHIGEKLPNSTW